MAKTVKETTKAPTGITITRNNEVLTVMWKIAGRDYGKGQYFQQLINTGKNSSWTPAKNTNIGIMAYSKAVTVKKTSFYPYRGKPILKSVGVRIKGHQKDYTTGSGKKKRKHVMSASGWATKYYTFNPPIRPSISKALNEELTNVCKFSWNTTVANNTTQMFTDVQLQSIFVKNSTESDGSKLDWSKALTEIKGSTGDRTFTEDTAILYKDGDTYTRWVRVRSRGPAGNSAWSYACQVYALPNQANVLNTYAEETEEGGFRCIVDWEVTGNQKNPIDRTMVQYTILTPDEDLTCPSGASWTDANISRDTSYGDAAVFSIDDQLGKDQCLFIRVNTQHDGNITYGKPQLSSVGYLRDPSSLSVRTDPTTYRATVQATNISEIPDSFLVVRYVPAEGDPIPIGVIPHGETSVTVQCPDWSDQSAIAFDVYAAVGSYEKQPREDGVDSYNIVVRMQSQKTISQGGQVPVAPQQVSVHRVEGKPDTVRVSWDWPWSEAGSAEIAWSDHDDAWESTDEPETYMVSNLHASHWNISGLETGRTWYIRVRLIKGSIDNSEDVTYGPWSDINQGTIDLSSAPNKPTLILSDSVIPGDGVTTASWVYTTTDNTYQAYGEVAIVVGEEYTPIAHALTEQHVTIEATQVGLEVGNVYNLSCRVRSASGRVSEWSDTVSVAIAEPLVCEITETSLEPDVVEVNPRSFGPGFNVSFNTTVEEIVTKLKVNMEPIQEGSGTPSPTNIRPIRGHSGVNAYVSPTQSADDGTKYSQEFDVSLTPTSTDKVPYTFKAVGRDVYGDRESDKIVGGTVAWNQLIPIGTDKSKTKNGVTFTDNRDGSYTIQTTAEGASADAYLTIASETTSRGGHVTLLVGAPAGSSYEGYRLWDAWGGAGNEYGNGSTGKFVAGGQFEIRISVGSGTIITTPVKFTPQLFDITQMFGSAIANYFYDTLRLTSGASKAWFRKFFSKPIYAYNAGELMSVNTSAHNTVGFNAWDTSTDNVGKVIANNGTLLNNDSYSTSDYIKVVAGATYYFKDVAPNANANTIAEYDADKIFICTQSISGTSGTNTSGTKAMSDNTHYIRVVRFNTSTEPCINLSDPSRNGEYEPYQKHTYPLDSSLTLRGVPKLDSSNNLYYDGDTYESDGTVTRKYGIVDLSAQTWNYQSAWESWYTDYIADMRGTDTGAETPKFICDKYDTIATSYGLTPQDINGITNTTKGASGCRILVRNGSTTVAPTGHLVYELATTTTETAEPFTNPQVVDNWGTEAYVTTGIVPVGHDSEYLTRDIFSGTLDLVSGVLTVDRVMVTLDGSETWRRSSSALNGFYVTKPSDAKSYSPIITDKFEYTSSVNTYFNNYGMCYTDYSMSFNVNPSTIGGTTIELWTEWLSTNPLQIVYELATPQTYQLTPHQIQTLVGQNNVWSNAGNVEVRIAEAQRDTIALKEMPFSLTVTGAGEGGLTSVSIERSEDYALDRPDEDKFQGHKGEVVLQTSPPIVGEGQIVFQVEDLLGSLDDGASYLIRAIVQDGLGQRAEATLGFEVHWRDQAVEPSAEITLDQEELIAFIKPLATQGMLPTDVADIYRLSADKPKLIVRGATFGETYVDPFPALGDMGGHRIVTRTKNGDYITEDNRLAMVDSPELEVNPLDNEELLNIIDFDGRQILFYWDSNYSNTWTKDFQRTRYLGGSDQGDWNEGIERTGNLTSRAITVLDQEMVKDVRRLAEYSGLCHVRTADGSSYSADVQVSDDYVDDDQGMVVNYSLSITRVDEQELDGMTLDQWNAENPGEEGEE